MSKPNLEEVEKAILESSACSDDDCHLDYLRNKMNCLGYNFPNSRKGQEKAYEEARKLWWDIREQKQPLHEIPVTDLNDLPSTRVKIGDKEYFVHGIVHGFLGVSDSVKNFVKEKAIDYAFHEGSELFMEDGIRERFDLKNVGKDFEDVEVFHGKDILKILAGLALLPISYIIIQIPSRERKMWKTVNKASNDIRYLPQAKEVITRKYLPEPLYMEYIADSELKRKSETERSEWMADKMRYNNEGAKEVHAIVGMAHEPQIEYFLKHS